MYSSQAHIPIVWPTSQGTSSLPPLADALCANSTEFPVLDVLRSGPYNQLYVNLSLWP